MAQALPQSHAYPSAPAGQNTQNAGLWAPTATSSLIRPPHISEQQWQDFLRHRAQRDTIVQQAPTLGNVNQAFGSHHLPTQSWQSPHRPAQNSPPRGNSGAAQQNTAPQPGHVYQQPLLQHSNSAQHEPSTAAGQISIGQSPNEHFVASTVSMPHMPPNHGQLHSSANTLPSSQVSDVPQHARTQNASASTSIPSGQHTVQKPPVYAKFPARSRSTNGSSSTDTSNSFTVHDDTASTVRLGRPSIESAYAARIANNAQQTPPRLTRAQSSGLSTTMSQESAASGRSGPSPRRRGRSPADSSVNRQDQMNGCVTKSGTRAGGRYLPR